jgi:hypothetical protein
MKFVEVTNIMKSNQTIMSSKKITKSSYLSTNLSKKS